MKNEKTKQVVLENKYVLTEKATSLILKQQDVDWFTVQINDSSETFNFTAKDLTDIIQAFSYLVGRAAVSNINKR